MNQIEKRMENDTETVMLGSLGYRAKRGASHTWRTLWGSRGNVGLLTDYGGPHFGYPEGSFGEIPILLGHGRDRSETAFLPTRLHAKHASRLVL